MMTRLNFLLTILALFGIKPVSRRCANLFCDNYGEKHSSFWCSQYMNDPFLDYLEYNKKDFEVTMELYKRTRTL